MSNAHPHPNPLPRGEGFQVPCPRKKLRHLLLIRCLQLACIVFTMEQTSSQGMENIAPCMAVLDKFTVANVPALGPAETEVVPGNWTNPPTPADLPGKGLAQHPML